jgi:N-succinyldiaminopimelate aminotransferase
MPGFARVADTTDTLTAYVFTSLRARIAQHTGPLHRLHIGDTWREPVEAARCEALDSANHPMLMTYAPVHGMPALLDAIGDKVERRTGVRLDRDAIQVVPGATGGLSAICQALLNPGEEVLLPSPFWPLIRGIISARGAVPVQVPFYDRLGQADFDPEAALEAAITDRTAAIYLNSPHNPTGVILDDAMATAIARVAERHDLWVLSDEVYEDIYFGPDAPVPLWTHAALRHRTLAVHSLSKGHGMAGSRIGYVHGPEVAMRAVRAVQTFQSYCASKPMQLAASRALSEGEAWLAEARDHYGAAGRLAASALGLPDPAGGTFLFFDATPWLDGGTSSLPFLERCVDAGVVLTPGGASGDDYESWVRLCFTCVTPAELATALAKLAPLVPV